MNAALGCATDCHDEYDDAAGADASTQSEGGAMRASPGDRLIVKSRTVGTPSRDAEILEVHGPDGSPPYVVRWSDNGHEALYFLGGDAEVHHAGLAVAYHAQ